MKAKSSILVLITLTIIGCMSKGGQTTKSKGEQTTKAIEENPLPSKYENESFSLCYPQNWIYNDTGWGGRDSMQNEVDFYPAPFPGQKWKDMEVPCWIHCVKAFLNIQWKTAKEAADVSKTFHALGNEPGFLGIYDEKDSLTVGGFPAYLIVYMIEQDNDTIVQKQFVTLLPSTHKVFYFNSNFSVKHWDDGQKLGDDIISTIKFKPDADIKH